MTTSGEKLAWSMYVGYLKTWADEHSGTEFMGQSPACYEEWLNNEAAVLDLSGDGSDAPGTIDPDIGMEV